MVASSDDAERPRARPRAAGIVRRPAFYCTPHMPVPGDITVSQASLVFEPDHRHEHVQEVGAEQYTVFIEVWDLLECGAIAMPDGEDSSGRVAFYLQLQMRTLDGQIGSEEEPWFVLFRLAQREDQQKVATILLDAIESCRKAPTPRPKITRTTVPFACLDCMAELEHAAHHSQLARQLSDQEDQDTALSAPGRLLGELAAYLTGSPEAEEQKEEKSAVKDQGSPSHVEKVTLRLPENCEQSLLTKELAECLLDYLPINLRLPGVVQWVLRYTPKAHGVSLETMYRNVAGHEKSIVLIQDTEEHVFGGFAPATWAPFTRFYGSGEAFVFSFGSVKSSTAPEQVLFYPWTSANECFMYADRDLFGMGGGDGRHAFVIQQDLLKGHSSPTPTFRNEILACTEEFVVRDIEVWVLEEIQ